MQWWNPLSWFEKNQQSDVSSTSDLHVSATSAAFRTAYWTGEKFPGGVGLTTLYTPDYWTLRERSAALFDTNLYARGFIRRLITNEINTGLNLESMPEEGILGYPEDGLLDWSEQVERRFRLWEELPALCDFYGNLAFGQIQAAARREALIEGDVLVVIRQSQVTKLPQVQLIRGSAVQTPLNVNVRRGNRIKHGVELDAQGRQVGYWIRQENGESKRIPAYGEKSGRRLSWLVYGTDKRLDEVRGTPFLSLMIQCLQEVDRYRDAALRKAVVNSMIALFIEKTADKPGTMPITGGAVRRGAVTPTDTSDLTPRTHVAAELIPGLVIEELQQGEVPRAFTSGGTDEKFGEFEEAIVQTMAWANEIPPETLRLSFSSNYSASQAATNEFKAYLNRVRTDFGRDFCQPIYVEWLLASALSGKVQARSLLDSWNQPLQYDVYAAWIHADWSGHIKPAVDLSKLVGAYETMIRNGLTTHDRAARELTGMKFTDIVKKLRSENEMLAGANAPIVEQEASLKPAAPAPASAPVDDEETDDDEEAKVA